MVEPGPPAPIAPIAPIGLDAGARTAMHRLTGAEWRAAVLDLTGVSSTGELPADFVLHGFSSVGAAEVTIAPVEFEQLEAAAWDVADLALPDAASTSDILGCATEPPLGAPDLEIAASPCVRSFAARFLTRAFRRPASRADVDRWESLYLGVLGETGKAHLATRAMVAAALLAPDFLFRMEFGLPMDGELELRRLDGPEQAARIALTLLDTPPSDALAASGSAGELLDPTAIALAADQAMAQADAATAWGTFFAEWADLGRVELVTKDPALFPAWTPTLQTAMTTEAELLWRSIALEGDADLRTLFTSTEGHIDAELAAVYGVEAPAQAFTSMELPPERAGMLTRGAFLAGRSHASVNSPTLRGKYVRTRLLCSDVPPPPEGVVTEVPEGGEGPLRERLRAHSETPQCSSCHAMMDPIGFAFEHYDPIGAWRELDAGFPIDDLTHLDGVVLEGGAELGAALASHEELPRCIAINAFSHVLGHIEQITEDQQLDAVTGTFVDGGHRLSTLVGAVADTLAFRTVGVPDGGSCEDSEEGVVRACATECGAGDEVCNAGTWVGCSAPRPTAETCNGLDDDCDGDIDGDVIVACEDDGRPGVAGCVDGVLTACDPVGGWETCNGLDDDGNGAVDEMVIELPTITAADITGSHPDCLPASNSHSHSCRAAVHRICAARGCAPTGIGPVASNLDDTQFALACVGNAQVVQTAYSVLSGHHGSCNAEARFGPGCNAAIHRFCASEGLTTGYGPIENTGDLAVVACTPGATVIGTTYSELSAYVATCTATGERMGENCDRAFHDFCRDRGYDTGHGPLENFGDAAIAACLGGAQ